MKHKCLSMLLVLLLSFNSNAQVAEVIKEALIKVIKQIDLQVQKIQTKTIWLQQAHKAVENEMSKLKLNEISDWTNKQKKLYADYFEELSKVKDVIYAYQTVKDIITRQLAIVNEYKSAYALFKQDKHFTADELDYMGKVYTGILNESVKNLDQLYLAINSFATKMTDAKRLEIINSTSDKIEQNLSDLRQFNNSNKMLSLQRAAEQNDIEVARKLYGL